MTNDRIIIGPGKQRNRHRVLKALSSFPITDMQAYTSLQTAITGFNLFLNRRLTLLLWNNDFTALGARILDGSEYVSCNAFLKDKKLHFNCTCGQASAKSESIYCQHAVCMLHALTRLDKVSLNINNNVDDGYFAYLLKCVDFEHNFRQNQKESPFLPINIDIVAIVLTRNIYFESFIIRLERLSYYDDIAKLPLALSFSPQNIALRAENLIVYLQHQACCVPVLINSDGELDLVTFDPGLVFQRSTDINGAAEKVDFIKQYYGANNVCFASTSMSTIGEGRLILNHKTGRMGVLDSCEDWTIFNQYYRLALKSKTLIDDDHRDSFSIHANSFRDNPILYDENLTANYHLKKDHLMSAPQHQCLNYRVIAKDYEHNDRIIVAVDCISNIAIKNLPHVLYPFSELLNQLKDLSCNLILTRKTFQLLLELCFQSDEGKINNALNIILAPLKLKPKQYKQFYDLTFNYWVNLQKGAQLFFDKDWIIAHFEKLQELAVYKISADIFGFEAAMNLAERHEMFVQTSAFYKQIQSLFDKLSQHKITLFINKMKVRQSRFEFALDATLKNIDWLEIKPEIRCDGIALDEVDVDALIDRRSNVINEEFYELLDVNTNAILERIAIARRVFKEQSGTEHEPLRIPRLWILDWVALRSSGVTVRLSPEDEKLVRRLLNFEKIDDKPLPKGLHATLRPYQQQGYSWLAFLYEHRLGACLADDMGLGKTIQVISLLGAIAEGIVVMQRNIDKIPHLIVVPPSLVFYLELEIQKFYPGIKIQIYTGSKRYDNFEGADVILTTYGTVRRDIERLKDMRFHVIIFDEAQIVKNLHSGTTKAVRQLKSLFKITMTGTPVENHIGEYYSIIDLAVPGLLGQYDKFRQIIKSDISVGLDIVIKRTRPFVLRRMKEAVLTDLPPKTEIDIYLDLTEEQKALYQKTVDHVRRTVDEAYRTQIASQARIIALTAILKLRQICITPQLINKSLTHNSPKMDFLIEKLRELMNENHSALVFSQFTSVLDIVGEALGHGGVDYLRLDGFTSMAKRKTLVKEFQSRDKSSVFLLSLKAGGQGLNLTRASYVFHFDPWWNPAVESQASDRVYRIGQKNKVVITRLLMRHTIEEKMMELKKIKQELYHTILSDGVIDNNRAAITREDIDLLLDAF